VAGVGDPQHAATQVDDRAQGRDEERRSSFLDEDPIGPLEGIAGRSGVVDRGVEQRPRKGHQQGGGNALAGHVGDRDRQQATPPPDPEHVEEVAADLVGRLVVAGDPIEPGISGVASGMKLRWMRVASANSASSRCRVASAVSVAAAWRAVATSAPTLAVTLPAIASIIAGSAPPPATTYPMTSAPASMGRRTSVWPGGPGRSPDAATTRPAGSSMATVTAGPVPPNGAHDRDQPFRRSVDQELT
jgi:hypothetical protein